MPAINAAKPASAVAENGPQDDRLGGAIDETDSSPFDGAQAKPAGSTDPGFPDFEPLENQGFQEPEIEQSAKRRRFVVRANQRGHVEDHRWRRQQRLDRRSPGRELPHDSRHRLADGHRQRSLDCPLSKPGFATDEAFGCEAIRARDDPGHPTRKNRHRSHWRSQPDAGRPRGVRRRHGRSRP